MCVALAAVALPAIVFARQGWAAKLGDHDWIDTKLPAGIALAPRASLDQGDRERSAYSVPWLPSASSALPGAIQQLHRMRPPVRLHAEVSLAPPPFRRAAGASSWWRQQSVSTAASQRAQLHASEVSVAAAHKPMAAPEATLKPRHQVSEQIGTLVAGINALAAQQAWLLQPPPPPPPTAVGSLVADVDTLAAKQKALLDTLAAASKPGTQRGDMGARESLARVARHHLLRLQGSIVPVSGSTSRHDFFQQDQQLFAVPRFTSSAADPQAREPVAGNVSVVRQVQAGEAGRGNETLPAPFVENQFYQDHRKVLEGVGGWKGRGMWDVGDTSVADRAGEQEKSTGAHQHKMRKVIAGLAHQQRVEVAAEKEGKPGSDGTAAADSGASGLSVAKWILGEEAAAAREAAAKDAAAKQAAASRERKETEKVLRAQAEVEQAPPKPWKPPAGWRKWPRKFTALILHDAWRHAELARNSPSSAAVEQKQAKGLTAAVQQAELARTNASSAAAAAEQAEGLMRTLQGEVVRRSSAADERAEVP